MTTQHLLDNKYIYVSPELTEHRLRKCYRGYFIVIEVADIQNTKSVSDILGPTSRIITTMSKEGDVQYKPISDIPDAAIGQIYDRNEWEFYSGRYTQTHTTYDLTNDQSQRDIYNKMMDKLPLSISRALKLALILT